MNLFTYFRFHILSHENQLNKKIQQCERLEKKYS